MKFTTNKEKSLIVLTPEDIVDKNVLFIMIEKKAEATLLLDEKKEKMIGLKLTLENALNNSILKFFHPKIIEELNALLTTQ